MNGFLLDTNVISELSKPCAAQSVLSFFRSTNAESLYLSVLTMGELRHGAYRRAIRFPNEPNKLGLWVESVEAKYKQRLLSVTLDVADRWAWFQVERDRSELDTYIAATASVHNLTMVTRNVRDFQGFDLQILNPWQS